MADFSAALPFLLKHEGGYSPANPKTGDPETNLGITVETARAHGYNGPMKDLPPETASAIYQQSYWRYTGIQNQDIATKLLDASANFGPSEAIRMAQVATNSLVDPPVDEDGNWGPDTEDAINSADPIQFANVYTQIMQNHYQDIVNRKPQKAPYLNGWLDRAEDWPGDLADAIGNAGVATFGALAALVTIAALGILLWLRK